MAIPFMALAMGTAQDQDRGLTAEQVNAIAQLPDVKSISLDESGVPNFMAGRLGRLDRGEVGAAAVRYLGTIGKALRATGREEIAVTQTIEDDLGQVHVRVQTYYNGLPIIGGDMVVHVDKASREVRAFNGRFVPAAKLPTSAATDADKAIGEAVRVAGLRKATVLGEPELVYVVDPHGQTHLAWCAIVTHEDENGAERDVLFANAVSGDYITRHGEIKHSLYRKIYNANYGTSLPGTLMFVEGGSSSDTTAMGAYDNSGYTYNYYSSKFGRDSYDDAGAQLISTVHYGSSYNNAGWTGTQMVYGDGDGSTFGPFALAFDVVAHELTHAVTDETANLVYQDESGALNEAMSDIFAASSEAWVNGGINSTTWMIGEDCYTPGTSGDALRYMDDPTADGSSYDYYPERYTGSQDYGGVHWNSGIANLAYYLLVSGGTHPRGKTTTYVNGIGLTKSEQIFYRALTMYMTSSTDFEGARNTTAQAAQDLYSTSDVDSVHEAWDAVGVPGGPVTTTELLNGVPVTNLSGSTGDEDHYFMTVPSGASDLDFTITGGSGDADLYVKYGSAPTTSSYDCRPYKSGNEESCTWASPTAGTWYVMIRAYSSYSGVTLTGSYSIGGNDPPTANFTFSTSDLTAYFTDTSTDSDGTVTGWSWNFGDGYSSSSQNPTHTYASGGTYSVTLTVTDDDGATDYVTKSVTVTDPGGGPCPSCEHYTGTLTGTGDSDVQPDGNYYYSAAGTHEGYLEGPSGTDFDLYLYKWNGSSWRRVASSTSSSSSESISYSGTSGYYYWKIYSYSGSGSYDFWLDRP